MSIEGLVEFSPNGSASGPDSGENTGVVSDISEKKATIKTKTCITLHHGSNIIGEIYPWYQFVSLHVSWSGISVCNIIQCVSIFTKTLQFVCVYVYLHWYFY